MGCPFIHGAIALLASFIIRYSITADIQGKMETEVKITNKQGISTIFYSSPLRQTTIYVSIHPSMVSYLFYGKSMKPPLYLSLGSSTSVDNTDNAHSSSSSAGSTGSSIYRGARWAAEHRWWSTGPSASLRERRRDHVSGISFCSFAMARFCSSDDGAYGKRWVWLHDRGLRLCHQARRCCRSTHRCPTTWSQWWRDQHLLDNTQP